MTRTPDTIFQSALEAGASDVHIAAGYPVIFRIDGILTKHGESIVEAAETEAFVKAVIKEEGLHTLEKNREIDTSYSLENGVRLRVNCHFERGHMGLVARLIPLEIPSLADVGLQGIGEKLCSIKEGLILFTGPTGSGKSTSLAAMISHIVQERSDHIVTVEDPVEFQFPSKGKGIIRQREFGSDFLSFPEALKRVLRQDPDVILVGEMRDPETISSALTAAETGHLVFGTLHTPNAVQTVDRIVDVFPPHQQSQVRSQLSLSLRAVIAQRLLPGKDGGRVAMREVLIATPAIANIIRENRLVELSSALQTGSQHGMCTFDQAGKELLKDGRISQDAFNANKS